MCAGRSCGCSKTTSAHRKRCVSMFSFFVNGLFVLPGTPSQSGDTSPTFGPLLSGLGASRAFLAE